MFIKDLWTLCLRCLQLVNDEDELGREKEYIYKQKTRQILLNTRTTEK